MEKNYSELAVKAIAGDQTAFSELYEITYRDMYYISLKYMKNEDEAEDVLQEAYIRAWKNISSLKDPDSFKGWLSRIVANQAKNALVKKNPLLFSQMSDDEGEESDEMYDIPDENPENQPELNYTQNETKELVRDMIDCLSDEQRLCILMFYFENMSITDISNALNVSENTVKSRLNYGRKNLGRKADELKKKGYKFYGFGALSLLLMLLRREKVSAAVLGTAEVSMHKVQPKVFEGNKINQAAGSLAKTAGKASAKATGEAAAGSAAAKTAAVGFIHTAAGKAAAIIAAMVVAGGAGAGIYAVSTNNQQNADAITAAVEENAVETATEESTAEETNAETVESTAEETIAETAEETTVEETESTEEETTVEETSTEAVTTRETETTVRETTTQAPETTVEETEAVIEETAVQETITAAAAVETTTEEPTTEEVTTTVEETTTEEPTTEAVTTTVEETTTEEPTTEAVTTMVEETTTEEPITVEETTAELVLAMVEEQTTAELDPELAEAFAAYWDVIVENADAATFFEGIYDDDEVWANVGDYKYTLLSLSKDDKIPVLCIWREHSSPDDEELYMREVFRLYQYDPEKKEAELSTSSNGYKWALGDLMQLDNGQGAFYTGDQEEQKNMHLLYSPEKEIKHGFHIEEYPAVLDAIEKIGYHQPEWYDYPDRSGFDNWMNIKFTDDTVDFDALLQDDSETAGETTAAAETTTAEETTTTETVQLPTDGDRIVLSGTVMMCSYDEIIELQGQPDPNNYPTDNTWLIIKLDSPQMITAMLGDASGLTEGEVWCIVRDDYGGGYQNDAYTLHKKVGQHVIFSIDPAMTFFPAGTNMPLGQPTTTDIKILE